MECIMANAVANGMHKAEERYEVDKVFGEEEAKQRRLRAILNKLTPQNFAILLDRVIEVDIKDAATLSGFVSQICSRAWAEPIYCEMYADFCYHLSNMLPDLITDNGRITFKKLLLNICQETFEGRLTLSVKQGENEKIKARELKLGNIRLLGEMYKNGMLPERIMIHCISVLLKQYPNIDEVDLEALCLLLSVAGEKLDYTRAKKRMDDYFDKMMELSTNQNVSLRVRFKLLDAIDLRKNNWQSRKIIEKPKKIWVGKQVAAQERRHTKSRYIYRPKVSFAAVQQPYFEYRPCSSTVLLNESSSSVPCGTRGPYSFPEGQDDESNTQDVAGEKGSSVPSHATPQMMMHKAARSYEVGKVFSKEDFKQRKIRGILNKLTHQNFGKLLFLVRKVNVNNVFTLSCLVSQICHRALHEPTFQEVYASFCCHLASELPDFCEGNEKITFKRLLLNILQFEFEGEEMERAEEEGKNRQSEENNEEKNIKARERWLGNVGFIGELYKKRMLTERIMHECIKKLLGEYQNPDEMNIEALCKLMSTIGEMIDHPKAKEHLDAYFDMMLKISTNEKLSSRIRFKLKDAIDLRMNKWQRRSKIEGPKKIEVHRNPAYD